MRHLRGLLTALMGAGMVAVGTPAQAEAPGLYYAWRTISEGADTCLNRSRVALNIQQLTNIQLEGNSIAGTTENATAVFVCLEGRDATTVMIMVSSTDDTVAFELREALKQSF